MLLVEGLLSRVGSIASNHLLVLGDADALPLDDLDVLQAGEHLVLNLEASRHGELGALLDVEGLVLERGLGALGGEVDGDGRPAGGVHGEGEDDAVARVGGVGERGAGEQAEGRLVALEGLVVGVWGS